MTPEEAISIIKCAIGEVEWNYPLDYAEAFEVAIEALEKQVPKKPLKNPKEFYGRNLYSCPVCNYGYFLGGNKFCFRCGQKFDWSEDDDKN